MTTGNQTIAVMMPKIVRKTLGLADGTFSHLAIENGGLVFRGDGVTRAVRLPVTMLGTYHGEILTNLFLYLSNGLHNGILTVTTGPLTKAVFFKKGRIVFSGSTDATDRIGSVALRLGLVTEEQLLEVESHDDPRRFGVRLKDAGLLTHDQLWEVLRMQVVSICCSLLRFPSGVFFFLPGCVPGDSFTHFLLEPNQVLFQGMVRFDEQNHRAGLDPHAVEHRSPLEVLTAMEEETHPRPRRDVTPAAR